MKNSYPKSQALMVIKSYYWVMIDHHFAILKFFLDFSLVSMKQNFQLILKQHKSEFITYEIPSGIHTNKNISEAVYTIGDKEGTMKIEYVEISTKLKNFLTRFGLTFETLRFDEKSIFNILLNSPTYWDYIPINAIHTDSPGVYTIEKFIKLRTIKRIQLKCDVFDGSVVNGLKQPILYSFVSDETPGYKIFYEPETLNFKKNKSVVITVTFYLEVDENEEVCFNEETLTFTLQLNKFLSNKRAFKTLKLIFIMLVVYIDLL